MAITIRHGCASLTRDVNSYVTYRDVIEDANVQAVLGGFDETNVEVSVNGVVVGVEDAVSDGDVLVLSTKSNVKGA
ncbi:MAG: hypothetical protein FJY85_09450 [Deltaproteobacteria bacterium]|nr:hypothetical protein [Deltaproteobacteria bacterium]